MPLVHYKKTGRFSSIFFLPHLKGEITENRIPFMVQGKADFHKNHQLKFLSCAEKNAILLF